MADKNNLTDYLIDRKSLKTKLSVWRNLALVFLAILLIVFIQNKFGPAEMGSEYIARITINNEINRDTHREEVLEKVAKNKKIKAVILRVNSPGGDLYSSENLYHQIKKINSKKPVVTVVEGYSASGAYLASIASDYIVARNTSMIGSIGALAVIPDVSELAKKLGIKVNVIKSGKLKGQPETFSPMTAEARSRIQEMINESYKIFLNFVIKERKITPETVQKVSSGTIFFGKEAFKLKLIDNIGNEENALQYLRVQKKISKDLKVKDVSIKKSKQGLKKYLSVFDDIQKFSHNVQSLVRGVF